MDLRLARSSAPFVLGFILAACSAEPQGDTDSAEEFAARINGAEPVAPPTVTTPTAPQSAPPRPQAEVDAMIGPVEKGTMTAPDSASCGAAAGEDWLGRKFTPAMTAQIDAIVPKGGSVRVLENGQPITGLKTSDRLNVMLDENGIIRDFRCG